MAVDTKAVPGRRDVRYQSYDELLAEVEGLARGEVALLGNWSLAQILQHLTGAFAGSIDGLDFRAPWYVRTMARMFMKKKFIYDAVPPGFQLPHDAPPSVVPAADAELDAALADFRKTIARLKSEADRATHPVLGKLTREEWDSFNLRHAEMHLSFVKPAAG